MFSRGPDCPHRRQFIIDRRPHRPAAGWRQIEIGDGQILSAGPDLDIREVGTAGGHSAWLVGHAYPSLPGSDAVRLAEPLAEPGALTEATYGWTGRWALIAGPWVLSDASNLMNLFHVRNGAADGTIVSGSLALVSQLRPDLPVHARRMWRGGVNWFPTPGSHIAGVDKLLPDQALDLRTGGVARVRRGRPERLWGTGLEGLAGLMLEGLARVMTTLAQDRQPVLPLTAGTDSRTLLAAAAWAGMSPDTFTLAYPAVSDADLRLPAQLAGHLGLNHRLIRGGPPQPGRAAEFRRHTFGDSIDTNGYFHQRDMYGWVGPEMALLRSNVSELGRHICFENFGDAGWAAVMERPRIIADAFPIFGSRAFITVQMRRWLDWVQGGGAGDTDFIDRFFIDQFLCGWMAGVEQSADLQDGVGVQVLNSAYLHDLLLAPDVEARRQCLLHKEVVRLSRTGLDAFPINPRIDRLRTKLLRRALWHSRHLVNELLNLPGDLAVARRLRAFPPLSAGPAAAAPPLQVVAGDLSSAA